MDVLSPGCSTCTIKTTERLWHRKIVEVKDGESLEGSPVWGCRFRRRRGLDSPLGRLVRDKEEPPQAFTHGLLQLLAASRVTAVQVKLGERSRAEALLGRELFVATVAGHARVVEKCLRRRADPWQRDSAGNVPLHLANEEVAHLLLDACPAAARVRNWQGQSAASHLISLGWQVAERIPLEALLKLEIQDEEEKQGSKSCDPDSTQRYVMLSCDLNEQLLEYVDVVKNCLEEKGIPTMMLKSEGENSETAMFRRYKDNLKAMVVFGTKDYGEKGRKTYHELKNAYRYNIDLIPLQLSETWPPEPACSGEHNIALRDTATRIRDEKMEKPMEKAAEIAKALRHLEAKTKDSKDLPTRTKVLSRRFAASLFPSPDELSEAMEDIFRLSLLCRQLTPGLEAMILFHLTCEAGMDVQEKLQGMICQLFQKHGQELKVGLATSWEQLATWLLEVLTRCALPSQSLPGSFAIWLADNVEKLQKVLPQTRFFASMENSDLTNLTTAEKNHLSWLLMGVRRLDRVAKRNDFVPKGETLDGIRGLRVETEDDLRRAAVEMHSQTIVPSVGEELVLALQAVRRCVKDVTNLQACAAWLHCAQLWRRSCQAEHDVQHTVIQLLEKSQVPFSHLKHPAIPSLETLWQKALSLWPRMLKIDLPGVHLCDVLVWELELASAALREMHGFLSSLMFCRDGAELMWTSAAPMDNFCDAAGLQEGLLLKTNAGPVFMQLRLFLSPGVDSNLLEFFNSMAMGHFLPSPFQPLWVTWLQLELALRKAEKAKNSRTLKAALHQAYQELGNEKFKMFVGAFWLTRLEALSKLLLRLEEEERMAEEDMEIALQDRAAMAQHYLNQVASTWDRLDPCIPEPKMPLELETWPEVQEERPAAGSPILEFYLSNVSAAAPESRTKISALADNRLQFWQHKVSSGIE